MYVPIYAMYCVHVYTFVYDIGVSLNAGGMVTGNLFKSLVSKEKRWYREGGYNLDLTCILTSIIVSISSFHVCLLYNCWKLV